MKPIDEIRVAGRVINVKDGHVEPVDLDCYTCDRNGVEHMLVESERGDIYDLFDVRTYGRILAEEVDLPLEASFTPLCRDCRDRNYVEIEPAPGHETDFK